MMCPVCGGELEYHEGRDMYYCPKMHWHEPSCEDKECQYCKGGL